VPATILSLETLFSAVIPDRNLGEPYFFEHKLLEKRLTGEISAIKSDSQGYPGNSS
jgi:hypothetical protein